ncbi:MAG: hypothetical protein K2O61_06985, partial [Bacteroidaceae bacterium]|nr:hypothetical protein [Bacteroidaceae bacterium]
KISVTSSISAHEVDANEAVTLKLEVKGSGNMKLISSPQVNLPKDFETYDTKVNDKFQLPAQVLLARKNLNICLFPVMQALTRFLR